MILKSIKLENIRSYPCQEIIFPEGSLLLSGDIGSGKSTILHAVEYCLFGARRDDLSGEMLLRHGMENGSVELKLEIDGKEIIIKRSMKRAAGSVKQEAGYIIEDCIKNNLMPIEMKTRILDLVGYPKSLVTKSKEMVYRFTVYTPQEQMKQVINENVDTRLNILRRVFDIDKYKRVQENAMIYVRDLKENIREMAGKIADLEEKKRKKEEYGAEFGNLKAQFAVIAAALEKAMDGLNKRKEELAKTEKEVAFFNEKKKSLEIESARLNEKKMILEKNRKSIAEMQNQLIILDRNLMQLEIPFGIAKEKIEKSILENDKTARETAKQKSIYTEKRSSYLKIIRDTVREIEEKHEYIKKIEEKRMDIEKDIWAVEKKNAIKADFENLDKELNEINIKIKECQMIISSSNLLKEKILGIDKCPTCLQNVKKEHKEHIHAEEDKKISESLQKMKVLDERKAEKSKKHFDLKKELEETEKKIIALERLKPQIEYIERMKQEISRKNEKKALFEKEILEIDEKLREIAYIDLDGLNETLEKDRLMLKKLAELEYLQKSIDEKKKMMGQLEKAITDIKEDMEKIEFNIFGFNRDIRLLQDIEKRYSENKKQFEAAMENERGIRLKEVSLKKDMENKELFIKMLDEEIAAKEKVRENIEKALQLQDWLESHFINLVGEIEKHIMAKTHMRFNELFRKWFGMLISDEAMSARLNDEFTPIIEQNGYETCLDYLSGGEKTAVALAYRLALNKVINDVVSGIKTKNIIILDEPTDGFSTEQLDKVKDVLDELDMKQVIIVSHESKVEGFVKNVVRLEKKGHASCVAG